jgi:hypothetical protein
VKSPWSRRATRPLPSRTRRMARSPGGPPSRSAVRPRGQARTC